MNNKPMVVCPHCNQHIAAERLPSQRKYRNEFGLDVFECPECHKSFKFESTEYFAIREQMQKGAAPQGAAIGAVKIDELLPSERMAIEFERKPRAPWRGPIKLIFFVALLFLVYLIFS